ncbi:MAG: permease, partial [Candidatus Eisenbacteria bacterium]
ATTFIGSMGNIPLATVLHGAGVSFAGVMAFIYSDLMVPPLVSVNAKYYGWRIALYIAGVMYASVVVTGVLMHLGFGVLGIVPGSTRAIAETSRFAIDYTFWLNLAFLVVAALLVRLHGARGSEMGHHHGSDGVGIKRMATYTAMALVVGGIALSFLIGPATG